MPKCHSNSEHNHTHDHHCTDHRDNHNDEHDHGHSGCHHHDVKHLSPTKIFFAAAFNLLITVFEIVGGILSGSLSLLSDAFHNLSDTASIVISYFAVRMGQKDTNLKRTFGYRRVEILTAFVNAAILLAISVFLLKEAYNRFMKPEEIKTSIMLIVASVGFIGNLLSVLLLHNDSSHSLNIKSAYLHLISDLLSSVAVIIGALCIAKWAWYWVDPVLTVIISVYIIRECFLLLKQTTDILLQSAPASLDLLKLQNRVEKLAEVENIHHVHVWQLDDVNTYFECHVNLNKNFTVNEANEVRNQIDRILIEEFSITHTTIQMEYQCCQDTELIRTIADELHVH